MKKTIVIFTIAMLLLLVGCSKDDTIKTIDAPKDNTAQDSAKATESAKAPVSAPTPANVATNQEDVGLDRNLAVDTTANPEKLSNISCSYDASTGFRMISLSVTNINKEKSYMISSTGVKPGFDTYFTTRGLVVKNPSCGVEELKPGESTTCTTIGSDSISYTNQLGINRITVQTPSDDGSKSTEALLVECVE